VTIARETNTVFQHEESITMNQPLDAVGIRILGALIEKEFTTPDNYPLTLNSLTAACNQTSNRDPVMELDEAAVKRSLDDLARRSLVRAVHRGDSRAMRYREELSQTLHLHQPELAALCVLLLRGPQTPGEIRTRAARIFQFSEPRHVEITLESLMALSPPLVALLPRRPGQKEARYTHLLSGEPAEDTSEEAEVAPSAISRPAAAGDRIEALESEVGALRAEVAELRAQLEAFRREFE
jgi:uncharacterized protein YceH (UPF0502 family)